MPDKPHHSPPPDDDEVIIGAGQDVSADLIKPISETVPYRLYAQSCLIVFLASLFYTYELALRISPSVMGSDLMASFAINAAALGTLSAFYYFVYMPMQLPVGLLMDVFGPRRLLTAAALICGLGAVLFGMTASLGTAQAARGMMGFGSAFAFIGAMKLASMWFPHDKFALFGGVINSIGMIGAMFSDDLMAGLVTHFGWREASIGLGSAGLLMSIAMFLVVRDQPGKHLARHLKHKEHLAERKLLASLHSVVFRRVTWMAGLIGMLLYLPINVMGELWGPFFFENVYQLTRDESTFIVSIIFLGYAFGAPLAGAISDRWKLRRPPLLIGIIGSCASFFVLIFVPGLPVWSLYLFSFLTGFFCGPQALAFIIGKEGNRSEAAGTSLALVNMTVTLGASLFQPLTGMMLDYVSGQTQGSTEAVVYTPWECRLAFAPMFGLMLLAFVILFFTRETSARQHERHPRPGEPGYEASNA